MFKGHALSIIVPAHNEDQTLRPLIERIVAVMSVHSIPYEIVVVNDHSTDKTVRVVRNLVHHYPVRIVSKIGPRGKASSLLQGFAAARYDTVAMIDADLQYPPEAIPEMYAKIVADEADIVVADRTVSNTSSIRRIMSQTFLLVFGRLLHKLPVDVQSGLKVFKKECITGLALKATPWAFDITFLVFARNSGYRIASVPIQFEQRQGGKSKIGLVKASWELGWAALKLRFQNPPVVKFSRKQQKTLGEGFRYKGQDFIHHTELSMEKSAFKRITAEQMLVMLILVLVMTEALLLSWHTALIAIVAFLTTIYLFDLLFTFFLIIRSFSKSPEIVISSDMLAEQELREWPLYTIFCPLYKEWEVVDQFVAGIKALNYPKKKLQVILLLEENDTETIEQIKKIDLPTYFETVIVPHSLPKTKPKACNYGLKMAKGEYVVIFDAEDIPEPSQLKKVVMAFEQAAKNVVCIQAKLNFYNPHQNILTRLFTAEYSLWFDLVLTGLQSINAPIPLGGTSNHFRMKDIKALQGWDSFNVTEDCDLGIRLVKGGYRTAVVDSVTLEEANSGFKNWFNQRSRWIKGYMQTYLVHMRSPKDFFEKNNLLHFITFQIIVGGKVTSMVINPLMWAITLSYFVFRSIVGPFIESIYPLPVLYMAVTCLVFGNFLYIYYYMIGCAKREQYEIIKYVFLVPLYWLMMSVASWIAFYKLIVKPFDWAKTKHGLHLKNKTQQIAHIVEEPLPVLPALS